MTKRQTSFAVVLSVALLAAAFSAVAMADTSPLINIVVLFFSGVVAGISIRGLRRPRGKLGLVGIASESGREPRRGRSRTAGRERTRGQRQPRKARSHATGKIKWFDETKGFGFITLDNGDKDCFVHRSAIQGGDSLAEGKRVEFSIVTDEKGRQAASNVVART